MPTNGRGSYHTALWVWPWTNAPAHLKDLLPPGRTGRWVVVVPPTMDEHALGWIRGMGSLVSRHPLTDDTCYLVGEA